MKNWLFGETLDELQAIAATLAMPRYAAGQIASWLYKKGVAEVSEMSDISLKQRELLTARYRVGRLAPTREQISADGTKKYLFPTLAGGGVESAYIPDSERATLCVSSQAGCRMGCRFCATGQGGFAHQLGAGEILNQFASIPEHERLTNLVYMGMGEPLDNLEPVLGSLEILTAPWGYGWSPTRITLSTAGVLPALEAFLERSRVHLAVSLHNAIPAERAELMPIERAHPIERVIAVLRRHDFSHQRRLSFEYILLEGINDSPAHIAALTKLLNGLSCRINLIRFHKIPGSPYFSPPLEQIERFRDTLTAKGFHTTIRASRGEDIQAACGLLSTSGSAY